jgi:hypothetical protein
MSGSAQHAAAVVSYLMTTTMMIMKWYALPADDPVGWVKSRDHVIPAHVRFTPESRHSLRVLGCPLCAKSGCE